MYTIRKYAPGDKELLRAVCMETAGEVFHRSERLLKAVPVIYNDYFTECEPENVFVAADEDGRAVGYVICAADRKLFLRRMLFHYIPTAARMHPFMLLCGLAGVAAVLRNGKNAFTHMHIDLTAAYQHKGAGSALINTLRDHLAAKGIDTLHINSITRDADAYPFYMKYGFTESKKLIAGYYALGIPTARDKQ